MKLDLKDKQLLLELDLDARQSLGQLAKKLRLSKRGVDYKMKRLEKENIIKGYKALIDSNMLGYYYFRILVTFDFIDEIIEKEFEDELKKSENFAYVFRTLGTCNYACALWVKDIVEFKEISDRLRFKFKGKIRSIKEHLPVDVIHLQNRFLLNLRPTRQIKIGGHLESKELDILEKGIIVSLAEDARRPIYEIASRLKADPKQVSYRIRKLEKEGIILGYRVVLNYQALGYSYFKCLITLKDIDSEEFNRIREKIIFTPQVIFINHGIGFADLDISAIFLKIEEFYKFIEDLKSQFPNKIENQEIILFGPNVKYNYAPFLKS